MRFSHDYAKLQAPVFTTIRAGAPFYEEGQVVKCVTPTTSFSAEILLGTIVSLMELSLPLLQYDTDSPGATRAEIVRKIQGLYRTRCPAPTGNWALYLLQKVGP